MGASGARAGSPELSLQKEIGVATSRLVVLIAVCAAMCWLAMGCSSSSSGSSTSGGGGGQQGLQFTSPTNAPTIELNQAGTASVSLTVNQSVTWSLANASGFGKVPAGASVSPTTGTSTTFTYTGPLQPCSAAAPVQVEVVATTSGTPAQEAVITVTVVQSPPCLASLPIVFGTNSYTSCPASGTALIGSPSGAGAQVGVYAQATIRASSFGGVLAGVPPFTWTLTGSLPNGLSLSPGADTTSIILSGTPVSAGCSTFQLQISDAAGGLSCNPAIKTSCVPTTFSVAVVPASLKVQAPAYSFSYDGIPYASISLQASGGLLPYTWFPDPAGVSTLAPGLGLSPGKTGSNFAEISGTPNVGDSNSYNQAGSPNQGQYPTLVYVNDSQSPYPAVGVASLKMQDYVLPVACSSSTASPLYIQPTGIAGNGGSASGGPVLADNYLQGTYAFLLRGFDAKQPAVIAGSMTLDGNGNVTSGEEDITVGASSWRALAISAGTYTVGATASNNGSSTIYNRGCATLTTSAGTLTFDFTVGGCSNQYSEGGAPSTSLNACGMTQNSQGENQASGLFTTGRIIEANDGSGQSAQLSGILRAQSTSSFAGGLGGPYAFGVGGWDSALGHYSMAGSVQASSGSLASAAADIDDAGTLSTQLTGGSGTLGTADANGRIAGTLTVGQASFDLALYMISGGEAFIVTTDPLGASHAVLSGEALTTAASFSNASMQNSHMLAMGGLASGGPDVSIGVLTFDGIGSVSGTIYEDYAGTVGTTSPVSAAYSVDASTGRTPLTTPQYGQTMGAHTFVAYLIPASSSLNHTNCSNPASCITGFIVGTDGTAQDGWLEFQTQAIGPPPPFTNRNVAGDFVYAAVENLDWMTPSFEGDVFATPSSSNTTGGNLGTSQLPFNQDSSYGCLQTTCPLFIPNDTFAGAYTINKNGTGTFGGGTTVSVTNGNVTFYIDESAVNAHPAVIVAEQ